MEFIHRLKGEGTEDAPGSQNNAKSSIREGKLDIKQSPGRNEGQR